MGVTIDGNNITITNATIQVVNGANDETGVSYIIITPDGGVGVLPFVAQGLPGQPTLFDTITLVQLAAGVALPVPNPVKTLIDPGGAGIPARYALTFYLNQGITGATGTPSISLATDLATTPALGAATDKFTLIYRNSDAKFVPTAQKVGDRWIQSTIAATSFTNTSPRLLTTIAIPAQPFDWYPEAFAATIVTGSVDTRVDLIVRLNNQATGDQVAFGKGLLGANAAGIQTVAIPQSPEGSAVPGAYGKVLATVAANLYLRAEQQAASSNSWSTPVSTGVSPGTTFWVKVNPVP